MKPILFDQYDVRATLQGIKNQKRELVKELSIIKNKHNKENYDFSGKNCIGANVHPEDLKTKHFGVLDYSKYKIGDVLWVRETWQHTRLLSLPPDDEYYGYVYRADGQPWEDYEGWKWVPSIHMPYEAARIFIRITNVRIERVRDISNSDALSEGVSVLDDEFIKKNFPEYWREQAKHKAKKDNSKPPLGPTPRMRFEQLWKHNFGSDSLRLNPWVWVYEFEVIEKPTT